ncbi:hypothetical protein [Lentzea sp.]|uniref:hypothetical protein n=1 Tax=Lentzea sp. TaxID=56099 RepID=UPI002C104366|nr:hypothetical protein [Lentzea sp.]HUQ54996.1 hypothetical protein [Lentzea sp.]
MADRRNGCGGCALSLVALFFGLPLTMLLVAPAVAAHIVVTGSEAQAVHLPEWGWMSAATLPLAALLVRVALSRNGRLRGRSTTRPKRWLGFLTRSLTLLGVVNAVAFVKLNPGEHVIDDGMGPLLVTAAAGVGALVVMSLWDRRPRRVTVEEVRAAAAEADRALRQVRAANDRVRRQAEQVRARVTKLRASGPPGHPRSRPRQAGRDTGRSDIDFHSLRVFHRESYQCADTAHMAYRSAQTSLHTMSYLVRRARLAPHRIVMPSRARAEMHAVATHLARSHGELSVQVEEGLGVVRDLNAGTSELKHEIRDSCGAQGRQWFEELEERIDQAREERRLSRDG